MDLERAYRVLGVTATASAHAIKQAHRKLVRRWHPDLYQTGTVEHSEATQMTRLINEAYSAISYAPLRYRSGFSTATSHSAESQQGSSTMRTETASDSPLPRLDKLEFWVRFICGALFGLFVAADVAISTMSDFTKSSVSLGLICCALAAAAFGLLSARYGDRFWHWIFQGWLRWIF